MVFLLHLTVCLSVFITDCHGNSVQYKHPSVGNNKIAVDKIVTLETDTAQGDKIVKIGIENIAHENGRNDQDNDVELENTSELEDKKERDNYEQLNKLVNEMKKELEDIRLTQELQR